MSKSVQRVNPTPAGAVAEDAVAIIRLCDELVVALGAFDGVAWGAMLRSRVLASLSQLGEVSRTAMTKIVGVIDRLNDAAALKLRTTGAVLQSVAGLNEGIRALKRRAVILADYPDVLDSMLSGSLPGACVPLIADGIGAAAALGRDPRQVASALLDASLSGASVKSIRQRVAELKREARHAAQYPSGDPVEVLAAQKQRSYIRWSEGDDGMVSLRAMLDPERGQAIVEALDSAVSAYWRAQKIAGPIDSVGVEPAAVFNDAQIRVVVMAWVMRHCRDCLDFKAEFPASIFDPTAAGGSPEQEADSALLGFSSSIAADDRSQTAGEWKDSASPWPLAYDSNRQPGQPNPGSAANAAGSDGGADNRCEEPGNARLGLLECRWGLQSADSYSVGRAIAGPRQSLADGRMLLTLLTSRGGFCGHRECLVPLRCCEPHRMASGTAGGRADGVSIIGLCAAHHGLVHLGRVEILRTAFGLVARPAQPTMTLREGITPDT